MLPPGFVIPAKAGMAAVTGVSVCPADCPAVCLVVTVQKLHSNQGNTVLIQSTAALRRKRHQDSISMASREA